MNIVTPSDPGATPPRPGLLAAASSSPAATDEDRAALDLYERHQRGQLGIQAVMAAYGMDEVWRASGLMDLEPPF